MPAFERAIKRYNDLCDQLRAARPPNSDFPLPAKLPTKFDALRNDPSLFEDVWILSNGEATPEWLSNSNIRAGINSLHVLDRSREERKRLDMEAENVFRSWVAELVTVSRAIRQEEGDI
jgi:hypothetical protein